MKNYTSEERNEILRKLKYKLGTEKIEYLGNNRYSLKERYEVKLDAGLTFLHDYKLYNEEGNTIPLTQRYNGIFYFTLGAAVVCTIHNINFFETELGTRFSNDTKYGLIDEDGNELLPCIYEGISVHLDGCVDLQKGEQKKATNVSTIISGKFNWDRAINRT